MMEPLLLANFETAGKAVLAFLHQRFGFDLWMLTRKQGDDWIVLQTEDHGYGVDPKSVFRWADSFCSQMVKGNGPRIAPRSETVPAYAAAPIGRLVKINAYIGQPLFTADGSLFGTLCAIDPMPQPESIVAEHDLLELLAAMLSSVLQADLNAATEARRSERLQAEALTDSLSNLYNRRAWDNFLESEEVRCVRFGHPAAIIVVDLDDMKWTNDNQGHAAGDSLIERTSYALRSVARGMDIVARLGGDEFGIISVECDQAGATALVKRLRAALEDVAVNASIGFSLRTASGGLREAWKNADEQMFIEKRLNKNSRGAAPIRCVVGSHAPVGNVAMGLQ